MTRPKSALLLATICFFTALPVLAGEPTPLWEANGKIINNSAGNSLQQNPQIIKSGTNVIVVWEDSRAGHFDLYAQKLDALGNKLWDSNGLPICRADGNQNSPRLVSDHAGGAIITWQDFRQANSDIFAQRIDSNGAPLWPENGLPVCTASAGQFAPVITTDGQSGAIIVWHDYRQGQGEDIFAQRLDQNGQALWTEQGAPICQAKGTQWYPQIVSDQQGGAIITWSDSRNNSDNKDIYAQRVNGKGTPLWQQNGQAVCQAKDNQDQPQIIGVNQGAIIVWQDSRNQNKDLYGQKINYAGTLLWQENGLEICTQPNIQENLVLAQDNQGGVIITWVDQRQDESSLYAQHLAQDGQKLWSTNGQAISLFGDKHKGLAIESLDQASWLVVWQEQRKESNKIFAQKLNSAGTSLWQEGGVVISNCQADQENPGLAISDSGQAIIVWQDKQQGQFDIFAQKISASGQQLWGTLGLVVCQARGEVEQKNIVATKTDRQEVILAWEDGRSGFFNIYLQKINRPGNLAWGNSGIAAARVSADQAIPKLVADGSGGVIVTWEDYRNKKTPLIMAQHFDAQGKKLWPTTLILAKANRPQSNPVMVADGAGGAIIAWEENRDILSLKDIFAQRVSSQGKLLWEKNGKVVISANGDQINLGIATDGAGGAILAWTDCRNGDRNPDIYAQRLNRQGQQLWGEEGVAVCSAPDIQREPKLFSDYQGGAIIAWTDKGGGSYDIYCQRLNKNGQALWIKDGLPINQLSRTQQNPEFGDAKIMVWEDYRFGNWDIFAATIDSSGQVLTGDQGSAVAVIPHTQYSPQTAIWKDNQVLVVWEDYRSSQQYEIYLQELTNLGNPVWAANGVRVETHNGARFPKIVALPSDNVFYVFWEDFTNGERAIYGQRYQN